MLVNINQNCSVLDPDFDWDIEPAANSWTTAHSEDDYDPSLDADPYLDWDVEVDAAITNS